MFFGSQLALESYACTHHVLDPEKYKKVNSCRMSWKLGALEALSMGPGVQVNLAENCGPHPASVWRSTAPREKAFNMSFSKPNSVKSVI